MLLSPIAFAPWRSMIGGMKAVIAAVLVLLVLYGVLGAVHMNPLGEGLAGGCPFMPGVNLCDMTPLAHLAAWQDSFVALTAQSVGSLPALILALAALFLTLVFSAFSLTPFLTLQPIRIVAPQPARRSLQEAFSDGILNPKIF